MESRSPEHTRSSLESHSTVSSDSAGTTTYDSHFEQHNITPETAATELSPNSSPDSKQQPTTTSPSHTTLICNSDWKLNPPAAPLVPLNHNEQEGISQWSELREVTGKDPVGVTNQPALPRPSGKAPIINQEGFPERDKEIYEQNAFILQVRILLCLQACVRIV